MFKPGIAYCLPVLLVCVTIVAWAQEKSVEREASERLVVRVDASSWISESFKVSPDSKRLAYAAQVGKRWVVLVDGQAGTPYDGIMTGSPIFSPDSQRVAYGVQVGRKWVVVVDGKEGKPYDGIVGGGGGRVIFDSSRSVYYLAGKGADIYLVQERIR